MVRWLSILVTIFVLSGCAFNGLFLFPYELNEDSTFTQYDNEVGDSLRLNFNENADPNFYFNDGEYHPGYTIRNTFFGSEGRNLNAWIMVPDSSNGTSLFFLHGNAGNIVYQYQLVEPYLERGYKVFLFDYSEFGFSEGKATRGNVLEDGRHAYEFMRNQPEFDGDKFIVYGQSLGGHLAAVLGTEFQEEIDGVVIEGGFSSHKDIAADRVPVLARIFVREMYSGKKAIRSLKKPLLVVHSIKDKTVPFSNGAEMYRNATGPKSFYAIDSCHICGPLYYADSISSRMQNMLQ
ncbi:MAG: alpha/beta hydrolase [bacterium]|nr:alpha/beta hydrolase [bacterium]